MREIARVLAFAMGVIILATGIMGILVPSTLLWVGRRVETTGALVAIAAIRIVFGLSLVASTPGSRSPRAIWLLGYLILLVGVSTALTGLFAVDRARDSIEWWARQGPSAVRLSSVVLTVLGGFVSYACAPSRHDSRPAARGSGVR